MICVAFFALGMLYFAEIRMILLKLLIFLVFSGNSEHYSSLSEVHFVHSLHCSSSTEPGTWMV